MNRIILTAIVAICSSLAMGQKDSSMAFTLSDARQYALTNSPLVKNAALDMEIAKKEIWETAAVGLPQVSSKFSYTYELTVPDAIKQFSGLSSLGSWMYNVDNYLAGSSGNPYFGHIPAPSGTTTAISDKEMRWGMTYDITASELIFSGAYIVGLQTTRVFKELSEIGLSKSQNDIIEQVNNAYFLVLIAQENKDILDSTYNNTSKVLDYVKGVFAQGLIEETDVDQMELTLSTIKNSKDLIERQLEVAMNLLKFEMGLDLATKIKLTDNLNILINTGDLSALALKEFNVENNSDFKLIETQENLSKLYLKLQKTYFLPDIAGFYSHQFNFNNKALTFTPPDMLGVSMTIPIFGSGMKLARIKQAKLALEKSTNLKTQVELGLKTNFSDAQSSFITALNNYQTYKKNVELSQKIYKRNIVKYQEGLIGSLELTLAQNQYLQAEATYFTSVINLTSSQSKLEKLFK